MVRRRKNKKTFVAPILSAFEAVQAAYALPFGTYLLSSNVIIHYEPRVTELGHFVCRYF
ncbi:hypothetical protein Hanom_Chr02g00096741 [Helianthus anomalus]